MIDQIDTDVMNQYSGILLINRKQRENVLKYNLIKHRLKPQWKDLLYDM